LVNPFPPVLDGIISNDIPFPRCMDTHKGEHPSLKLFGIIDWFEAIPIAELKFGFFFFNRIKKRFYWFGIHGSWLLV
jgi:hypothetical protein